MKRSSVVWIIIIVVVIIIAGGIWYWAASSAGMPAAGTTSTSTTSATTGTGGAGSPTAPAAVPPSSTSTSMVVLNSETTSTLGSYLAAPNGMTLYISKSDKARVSNCTGACAVTWPPYTISASDAATLLGSTPGITGAIGFITRANGTKQVTYNNLPLYFFVGDKLVGDAKGNNVGGFVLISL